jgi:hypothetical protein
MTNGIAPWWAHRQLLLPGDTSPVLQYRGATPTKRIIRGFRGLPD